MVGVIVVASDWQKMRQVLAEAYWSYLPVVLVFTFLSYAFYSYGFAVVAQMLDIPMRKRELAEICFISTVVNHVLTAGGLVGYSLRYLLMNMYKVSFKDVLSSSIFHVYLTSLDMLTILPLSFIYLLFKHQYQGGVALSDDRGFFDGALFITGSVQILTYASHHPPARLPGHENPAP
jgi:uncharacterized membrane protein YbhN (UPF0104 family)